jgi:hypothetical protein
VFFRPVDRPDQPAIIAWQVFSCAGESMARSADDDREIPQVSTWDDMFNRAAFSKDIDGSKVQLKGVLAPYRHLSPMQPCGLSNCRTPNANGYLIVAEDGRETNIGADCGKKHFPDFHAQAVVIDRITRERELRARAIEAKSDVARYLSKVETLRTQEQGADWVSRCIRGLKAVMVEVEPQAWHTLKRRAATASADVNEVRRLSKAEAQARQNTVAGLRDRKQAMVEEVRVGRFTGLEVLSPSRDLHSLLVTNIRATLDALAECDPKQDAVKRLRAIMQSYGELDGTVTQVEWAVASGRDFFVDSNLKLIAYLATDMTQRRKLEGLTVQKILTRA